MSIQAKLENGARNTDSTVVELNRIVTQAEELLKTLGEEGGAAAEAVRQRVSAPRTRSPRGGSLHLWAHADNSHQPSPRRGA